ncbi:rhamnogalacturonan lyase [Termitidicoccus mucosus]
MQPSLMENLDRGVVAVRTGKKSVYVSWRLLGTEPRETAFNVYRITSSGAPVKINSEPIVQGTIFTDTKADFSKQNIYVVRAIGADSNELPAGDTLSDKKRKTVLNTLSANCPALPYLSIPLRIPKGGTAPDGIAYTYEACEASVGDLDGDGEYEIVLKWKPTNWKDNAHTGYSGNTYLDAYKINGQFLWRIDLGKNIRSGSHYTQFMVYDLDGDGIAEIACKTADGTVDGVGKVIGDADADYRTITGKPMGKILDGPEYLTIFNGRTGAAMATVDYVPARGKISDWGDDYGNRVDRFLACIAYLDGQRPSLVMCRGYYARSVLAAWDWRNGKLTQRWVFDSADGTLGNDKYAGQGAHSLSVGDVDGDGCDEITYGACAIDHDGKGLYSTGLGHGDALHMSVMDPTREGQQIFMVHEKKKAYGNAGIEFRDARTGKLIFGYTDKEWDDIGRGVAGDIDPRYKGYEVWAPVGNIYSCKGENVSKTKLKQLSFLAWWDGDLLRELLDKVTISKWNWKLEKIETLLTDPECESGNGTKATPVLSADIFGDWREEVIFKTKDNHELRIYTTTIPTKHRFHTLMHDRQYREAIAWQNVGYNQPPHPSFYLGEGMTPPAQPNIVTTLKEPQTATDTR